MDLDEKRVIELIYRHLEGRLSDDEATELFTWVSESEENRELYEFFRNKRNLVSSLKEVKRASLRKNSARSKYHQAMDYFELANINGSRQSKSFRKPMAWMMAAASILVILSAAIWHPWYRHGEVKVSSEVADLAPGGNRAVLVLADGQKLDLNKATDGHLPAQGAIQVVKVDSSLISYSTKTLNHNPDGKPEEVRYNTIITPKGGQFKIVLSDGSIAWLNAASSIRFPVPFSGSKRLVQLTGEGYFEVVKNTRVPFVVETKGMQIDVMGTKFDVRSYSEDSSIQTTLIDGMVKITAGSDSSILRPGDKAIINTVGALKVAPDENYKDDIAWVEGRFQFTRSSIESVMNQLARWYNVEIIYEGKPLKTFSGNPRRDNKASDVLNALKASGGVDFRIEGNKIIVLSK